MDGAGGFGDLLQQAEQLAADIDGNGELPRVERNLRQLADAGQQFLAHTSHAVSKDASDVKASILLGSKGFDLPKISQRLEGLSSTKTFEPIEPVKETDIQGFLKNERENSMLSIIEECKKSTFDAVDKMFWTSLENKWEQEKQKILNCLIGPSNEELDVSFEDTSPLLCEKINMKTRSAMDTAEIAYAKEVYQYNEHFSHGGLKSTLPSKFLAIFKELDDKKAIELWDMVGYMIDVPRSAESDVLAARFSLQMQTAFIHQARKYLEKLYSQYIQNVVYGNLQQADLGPRPGIYFLVKSFLKIHLSVPPAGLEDGSIDGNPVWAVIFCCLRCGSLSSAVEFAKNAGDPFANFVPFLIEYMENDGRRLNPTNENRIRVQYRSTVRKSKDPYKRAVYGILAGETTDDCVEVAGKIEDYLWIKLCQLHPESEDTETIHTDKMTLSHLQKLLLEEYGESHFNAYQQPFLYFQVLFLTAQFEAAIEFLSRIEPLRCHAVHVAIVLHELHLLSLPASYQAPLLTKVPRAKGVMRHLNFARLITMYVKKFEVTDPRETLQYFFILRDLKGPYDVNLFMACVSELVQETKEFEMLLGKIEQDGCRKPGAVDKFNYDTQAIIELVASDCEKKGQYEDAIKLYDLSNKREKVIEILNKVLSQVVPGVSTNGSNRQRLERIALNVAERYKDQSNEAFHTFYLILDLMTFFNLVHSNMYGEALTAIIKLKLLPFSIEEVEPQVATFALYAEEIRRNFPDILLSTMNLLHLEYKKVMQNIGVLKEQKASDDFGGQEQAISTLRMQARTLITFSGMIPYRMPGDTNAKLVQLEMMMN